MRCGAEVVDNITVNRNMIASTLITKRQAATPALFVLVAGVGELNPLQQNLHKGFRNDLGVSVTPGERVTMVGSPRPVRSFK